MSNYNRPASYKHGLSGTRVYTAWGNMLKRCYNLKSKDYQNYGGRGITVCNRWRNDFLNFFNDMGVCPNGLTLERRNNNGNYSPINCYWATWKEQYANRRLRDLSTYKRGKEHCRYGIKLSKAVRRKMTLARLAGLAAGRIQSWNKGNKTGQLVWNKGKHLDPATCRKISKSSKGKMPWQKVREQATYRNLLLNRQL